MGWYSSKRRISREIVSEAAVVVQARGNVACLRLVTSQKGVNGYSQDISGE